MTFGKTIGILLFATTMTFVLFDVTFVFDVAGSSERQAPDPDIEAAYAACFKERDDEIHTTAFSTIDNPDVQKEFITSSRARAQAECRQQHPERLITVTDPARFNLVDLDPRFW